MIDRETNDPHHQSASPTRFKRVEMKEFHQLCSLFGEGNESPVRLHLDRFVEQHAEWIGHRLILFNRVAHMTGVNQVIAMQLQIGPQCDGLKMFGVKVAGAIHPLLAFEAINAAKGEPVAQPFTKLNGRRISLRAVSATMRVVRIMNSVQAVHCEDFD